LWPVANSQQPVASSLASVFYSLFPVFQFPTTYSLFLYKAAAKKYWEAGLGVGSAFLGTNQAGPALVAVAAAPNSTAGY
jgi:hypothetical protein